MMSPLYWYRVWIGYVSGQVGSTAFRKQLVVAATTYICGSYVALVGLNQ